MSPDLKARITSPDESVRLSALGETELEMEDKRCLISGLTLASMSDSRLTEFLESNPRVCDDISPDVLTDPACPDWLKAFVLGNCRRDENLIRILGTSGISKVVEEAFDREHREREAVSFFKEIFSDYAHEEGDKEFLKKYLATKLPYFIPRFEPQNFASSGSRLGDLVGGVPYTSAKYPWPECPRGLHKQPIVQIDLANAGRLLKVEFGGGLLQVWANLIEGGWSLGSVFADDEDDEQIEIRVIPQASLREPSDENYPERGPWLESMRELELAERLGERESENPCLMRHSESRLLRPRVSSWIHFGSMYLPRFALRPDREDFSVFFFQEFPTESFPNPDSDYIPDMCYLGGFGGGRGGQIEPYPLRLRGGRESRLLFNYQSDGDSYTAVNFSLSFILGDEGPTFGYQHYRHF